MYLERTSTYSVASTRAPNMLPPRSPAKQAHHHLAPPPSTFGTKALYTIGTLACLLLFISTFHERRNSMKHVDESGRWNGQRVQDRQLTMQLDKNDLEIVSLKAQLSSMSSGSKLVDTSMQDQEETVRKLQKRFDNEKAARAKAQASSSSSPFIDSSASMTDSEVDTIDQACLFNSAMPKEEIGAIRFLKEHPSYDGRGTVIAILDTGVDPGAAGLQITTDGKPKVIDVIDCTGSGDVDTSKVVSADPDNMVTGASGRMLKINPEWKNPSGEWRVGCKHLNDLITKGLANRCKAVYEKKWGEAHRLALVGATSELAAFEKANSGKKSSDALSKEKAELEARVAYLKEAAKSHENHGPMLDCVVWHDGENWRVAIDTTDVYVALEGSNYAEGCTGLLADFEPLTDYRIEHKYGTFSALDACNFGINVYDAGATLSIVVDCGAHGTHVAGITAAHFPEDPGMNGVAPGAQIISCKIGDTRLGSMETGTGLTRALIAVLQHKGDLINMSYGEPTTTTCMCAQIISCKIGDTRLGSMETGTGLTRALIAVLQHKCDLINMSYGEPTTTPNQGRFIELATELVHKHGVIFVSSAGNAGPALSTVGAPGGTSSAIYSIGAYVSPAFAAAGHSIRETPTAGTQYTWSSRGPTPDGHVGVTFSAPGGAIAPVPQWTQQKKQLMNGTSRLKATGGHISPERVRRAVENTCMPLGGASPDAVLTYGRGLIQIDEAFKYLENSGAADAVDSRYEVGVVPTDAAGRPPQRGVYLRQGQDTLRPSSFTVTVMPKLHEDALNPARLAVEDRLLLEPTIPAPVSSVDSNGAFPGSNILLGPLNFKPGTEHRHFYEVPHGATWAEVVFRAGDHDTPKLFLLRASQLQPGSSYKDTEARQQVTMSSQAESTWDIPVVTMSSQSEYIWNIPVVGGAALELTLAQFWSSLGPSSLTADIAFHGVTLQGGTGPVVLDGADGLTQVVRVKAEAKLTHIKIPVRPTESILEPLATPRDTLPDGRVIRHRFGLCRGTSERSLVQRVNGTEVRVAAEVLFFASPAPLDFSHEVCAAAVFFSLVVLVRLFTERRKEWHIYDGVVESQFYHVHDYGKRLIASGDAYPENVTLKKGDYVIKLVLRHDNNELLEKMKNTTLVMQRQLETAVTVPVYRNKKDALTGGSTLSEMMLRGGDRANMILGPIPDDKLPKDATGGRILYGKLTLGQLRRGGSGAAPASFPISFITPPAVEKPAAASTTGSSSADEEKTPDQKLAEAIRDTQIKFLKLRTPGWELADAIRDTQIKFLKLRTPEWELAEASRDTLIKFLKDLKMEKESEDSSSADPSKLYNALLAELQAKYPTHLPLLTEHLHKMDGAGKEVRNTKAGLTAVIEAADAVVSAIDAKELACHLAMKCTEESPEAQRVKKEMDDKKTALVDALQCKCTALLDLQELEAKGCVTGTIQAAATSHDTKAAVDVKPDAFQSTFTELRKWVDTATDNGSALLHAKAEARAQRLTNAIKALDRAIGDDKAPKRELFETRCELLAQLGWTHLERQERATLH
eukprot:gene9786-7671_t